MLTFQQIIQKLIDYWEKRGCVIHQGHGLEVGAGRLILRLFCAA